MGPRALALILAGMLAFYLLLLGRTGILFIQSDEPLAIALGLAILVFPLLGAWIVIREVRFGFTAQKMSAEATEPNVDDETFESAKQATQAKPDDWQAWFRVASAYEDAGDRRMARRSMYHAASLFRVE